MRYIKKRKTSTKIFQPYQKELAKPNALIPADTYDNFKNFNDGKDFKNLQNSLAQEQGYVCAYCLGTLFKLDKNGHQLLSMKVEHFSPQSIFNGKVNTIEQTKYLCNDELIKREDLRVDYANLLAVCQGKNDEGETHCDTPPNGKGNKELCHIPNPSIGKIKNFDLKIKYTANFSILSMDTNIDKELNEVLNLNETDLRRRRKRIWAGIARKVANRFGRKDWEKSGNQETVEFLQETLGKYKQLKKDGSYFEFYDCIIYQLEKRIKAIQAKL